MFRVSTNDDLEIEAEDLEGDLGGDAFAPRKPGRLARLFMGPSLAAAVRWVGIVILVILAIMLVAANWAPVRLDFVLWKWDLPKAIVFVVFALLGALVARFWSRRRPSSSPEE